MKLKPWEQVRIVDKLVEIGPWTTDGVSTNFTYLEFEKLGRALNIGLLRDIESKLKGLLGKENGVFYWVSGQHAQTRVETNMMVALGQQDGSIYAIDMKQRGLDDFYSGIKKQQKLMKVLRLSGWVLIIIGIPTAIIFIGLFLMAMGAVAIYASKKVDRLLQYQLDMISIQTAMVSNIPDVKYL